MEKAGKDVDGQKTPEGQITQARPSPFAPAPPPPFQEELGGTTDFDQYDPSTGTLSLERNHNLAIPAPHALPNGGRRVSLASGEAEKIQMWAAKRNGVEASASGGLTRSPVIRQASAARRGSIPYPAPPSFATQDATRPVSSSPNFSPLIRPTPSTLHLTAIRNNNRRASMPGPPQLLSSGPFTPPRIGSAAGYTPPRILSYPIPGTLSTGLPRELSSIKDHDSESASPEAQSFLPMEGLPTTFITPSASTYSGTYSLSKSASGSSTGPDSSHPPESSEAYNVAGPLPSPAYSFGNKLVESVQTGHVSEEEAARQKAMFESFERGRLGSLASIGSGGTYSDTTVGTVDETDYSAFDASRFDPSRRASA
jgi:hypothetical protein